MPNTLVVAVVSLVPLSFLTSKRYSATIWKDADNAAMNPNQLSKSSMTVDRGEKIKLSLAADGGFVAQLVPIGK